MAGAGIKDVPVPEFRLPGNVGTSTSDRDIAEISTDLAKFNPTAKVIRVVGANIVETWNIERG